MMWGAVYGGGILYVYLGASLRQANRVVEQVRFCGVRAASPRLVHVPECCAALGCAVKAGAAAAAS